MKISISKDVFVKYPQLKLAFILAENLDNKGKAAESKHLLKEVENLIRLNFHKKAIKDNSFIEPWALAQLEFGGKAHHYHNSVEKLLKIVLSGKSVAKNDVLDNIYRFIALKYLVPVGVDDFHKIEGDLIFDIVKSSGRKGILGNLKRGELYYRDSRGVLSAQIDYWKNKRTEIEAKSYVILVHIVALPPVSNLKNIAMEMALIIESFCGAKTKLFVLGKGKNEVIV